MESAIAIRVLKSIYAEIRRREVLRTCAVYVVGAWLVLQVAEVTLSPLGFPEWVMRALIIAAVVGFPVVFFLAWVINITSRGVFLDLPLWHGESDVRHESKKDYVVFFSVAAVLMIGAYSLGTRLFQKMPAMQTTAALVEAPPNSIAVLAFENFSPNADSDYFADGLAEEILNRLSGLRELSVTPRTSSFQFRNKEIGIKEIAQNLVVRYVLEGSVRQAGDRIKVSAKLIDSRDGYPAFSKSYDRKLEDIFAIQEEIAAGVVNELEIVLSVASAERLQTQPTENLDAYIYYLQGQQRLHSTPDIDGIEAASQLFNEALKIDPTFSRAYAGICEAHLRLYEKSTEIDDFQIAESACDKAVELDSNLSTEVYIARSILYRNRGWYERADEQVEQAIASAPAEVDPYIELGEIRMAEGRRAEAEAAFLRAVDMKKQYWRAHAELGRFYFRTERYAEAVQYQEVASKLTPDSATAFGSLGATYWMLGETDKALAAYNRSLVLKPTRQGYTNKGFVYYYSGRFSEAAEMQKKALELAPEDHRIWGRLGEAYSYLPGKETESRLAFEQAIELAKKKLAINEKDWDTMGTLGLFYAYLGQHSLAAKMSDQAVKISQRDPNALYIQALVRLKGGDQTGAIAALDEAVSLDEQYRQFIPKDPALQSIKETEAYVRLIES